MTRDVDDYLALYSEQFRDKDIIQKFTRSVIDPAALIKNTYQDLKDNRFISTAFGVQLDRLGDILGIQRLGRSDEAYRAALKFQIFVNTSDANPEAIIEASRVLAGGDLVRYWENYPAGFQIFTNGPNVLDITGSVIQDFQAITSGGDNYILQTPEGTFNWVFRTAYEDPEALAGFLAGIAPAGTDKVIVTYSLGREPLFGFSGDFAEFVLQVVTPDGVFNLETEGGEQYKVRTGAPSPSPDGFGGFAELEAVGWNVGINAKEYNWEVTDGSQTYQLTTSDDEPYILNDYSQGPQDEAKLQGAMPAEFNLVVVTPDGEFNLETESGEQYIVNDITEDPVIFDYQLLPSDTEATGDYELAEGMTSGGNNE